MATTLDRFHPYDAGPGADSLEDRWRSMARHWLGSGPLRGEGLEQEVFADSTGMQVKVRDGEAWLAGHKAEHDSQETLGIAVSDPTDDRIDRVILRNDFINNRIELDVLTGTPGATPVPPSLTQSSTLWEISLAQVLVQATVNTIAAEDVTDERVFAVPRHGAGGVLHNGKAEHTSAEVIESGSETIEELDVTVVVGPNRQTKVAFFGRFIAQVSGGAAWTVDIFEDGSPVARGDGSSDVASEGQSTVAYTFRELDAGIYNYTVQVATTAGIVFDSSAQRKGLLTIEDAGPA